MIHKTAFRPSGFVKKELYLFYTTFVVVFVTGVVWLYFDNYVLIETVIGQAKHPLQKWLMKSHGFAAIFFTGLLGLIYGVHIKRVWPMQKRRASGLLLVGLILVVSLSGFLLYYTSDEAFRWWSAFVHWALGLSIPAVLIRHIRSAR